MAGRGSWLATVRSSGLFAVGALLALALLPRESVSALAASNPATTSDQAVAYQLNVTHNGALTNDTLTPPLIRGWSVNLGALVSYPLIANGHVFVTAGDNNSPVKLYALNLSTGATAWGPIALGSSRPWANATYENGRVFTVNYDGKMQAFDENTGSILWTTQLRGQYAFSSPPTASNGIVYAGGAGSGGTLYAVRETDGALQWTGSVMNGDNSSPAVTNSGVYVSYACAQTYDFNPSDGSLIWHHTTGCEGGGGKTPVLGNGQLFVRDAPSGNVVLDPSSGTSLGTFTATPAPAIAGSRGYFTTGVGLTAIDLATNTTLWTFAGDGSLSSAPLVVNGLVYVASTYGNIYALDQSGTLVWTSNVAPTINYPDEQNVSQPLTGLAAGSGYLLVPAGATLNLYAGQETLYPGDAAWGSQPMGLAASPASFTLTDNMLSALQVAGITASGDFSQTNNCPATLAPGAACSINVTFKPSATGTRTGLLTVTDNAAGSPHAIPLSGIGAPAAPPYLVVSPSTSTITAGGTQAYQVDEFDGTGADLGDVTGASTFAISPSGSCSANSCTATDAMLHTVTATYSGMSVQASLSVNPGPPDHVTISPASTSVSAGTWTSYTSFALDQYGNAMDASAATYAITPDGSCQGTGSATCSATTVGSHTVTVTLSGKLATASLTITPGPVNRIQLTPYNVTIAAGTSQSFATQAFDQYGNAIADVTNATTFTIGPSGSCTANACTATNAAYLYTVTATYAGKSAAVNINVKAGPFDHVTISPVSTSTTAGYYVSFSDFGVDLYGNPAIDPSASTFAITPDGNCSVGSGSASCTSYSSGPHLVTATLNGKSATASLAVNPGAVIRIRIAPIINSIAAGTSQAFTARTVDGYLNTVADVTSLTTFAFSPNGSCAGNVCTAPTQATTNANVTGSYNGWSDLINVAVTAGTLDHIDVAPATSSVTAGNGQAYSDLAYDQYNNFVAGGNVTSSSTFAISPDGACSGATCTATKAGAHTVTVTFQGKTATAALTVSPDIAAQLTISPASATIVAGHSQAYTASASDQYGNGLGDVTASTVFWVDVQTAGCSQNVCSATKAGTHQVIGSYQSVEGTSALTVNPGPASALTISPASFSVTVSQTASLTANGTDSYGNAVDSSSAAWSIASGTPGSISPTSGSSSIFTASATVSGTGKVIARLGTLTASSAVSVVPAAPTNLTATALTAKHINLSWSAASGAVSYTVYRSAGTSGWVAVKTGISPTTYTDDGLTPGTTYTYRVVAVSKSGLQSAASNTASATATK